MSRQPTIPVTPSSPPRQDLVAAIAALDDRDVGEPVEELSDALLIVSGASARLRAMAAHVAGTEPHLDQLDDATARAIAGLRALQGALQSRARRSDYHSAAQVAREVVDQVQGILPPEIRITADCGAGPAVVALDRPALRAVYLGLTEACVRGMGAHGSIAIEVVESNAPDVRRRARCVEIRVRCSEPLEPAAVRLERVRQLLREYGGSVEVSHARGRGTTVLAQLPCVF